MTRRSGLALLVVAGLAAMLLWWRVREAGSVVPPPVVQVASVQSDALRADRPIIESVESPADRLPATEAMPAGPPAPQAFEPTPPGDATGSIRLIGTVIHSHGELLTTPETAVELTRSSGERRIAKIEKGEYSFDRLRPGTYSLSFRKPAFKHVERTVTLRADEPVHREDLRIEEAWMITVHLLTPEGEDLRTTLHRELKRLGSALSVFATVDAPGDRFAASLLSDRSRLFASVPADSTQDFAGEGPFRIYVHADPPVFVNVVLRDEVVATQKVQDPVEEWTFVVGLDRIRALLSGLTVRFVEAESGLPAVKANVTMGTSQRTESGYRLDEQGVLRIEDHIPGIYDLRVMLKGHPLTTKRIELPPGRTVDLGTIALGAGITVQGKCIDGEGHARKVNLALVPLADDAGTPASRSNLLYLLDVDDQGLFSESSLPPARFEVRIFPQTHGLVESGETGWAMSPVLVDTRNGPVENLVVVVHRPVTVALHPTSAEVRGTEYAVTTADGIAYHDGTLSGLESVALEFVPGDYTLRLSRASKLVREIPLTVGTSSLTIDVEP